MSLLYANILFQLALFNHAFSFLSDSDISVKKWQDHKTHANRVHLSYREINVEGNM